MGNLRSVERAVRHLGFDCEVRPEVGSTDRLIIPGVGAFGAAMDRIRHQAASIQQHAASGRPLLGICLGQQMLFDRSEEHGDHRGLGLIPGSVRFLPVHAGIKVPHIGWNGLEPANGSVWPTADENQGQVYFVHSLYTECDDLSDVAAWTEHGIRFASAVRRNNVWGCQFHPEKSGEVGLAILREFLVC
ncbi:MAG: Imidazole glycerol phosphate synthase subunit HisH [Fimbriimonadaceae bacterium]|nr:Imidazole glycerol phosphate synthase subunit HisH [Fimbriimonadaceae bacterium]